MKYIIKITLFTFLIINSLVVFSQSNQIDYIVQDTVELHKIINDIYSNLDSTQTTNLDEVDAILKASLFLKDTAAFFKVSLRICVDYFSENNLYQEGILFLKNCQRIIGNVISPINEFDNALGIFYKQLHFHSESLDHYYKSVSWYEKYNPNKTTIPLGNLAQIYFINKNFEKSLKYNEQALNYSLKLENKGDRLANLTFDYFRIGQIYHELGKTNDAKTYFKKSLHTAREYASEGRLLLLAISKALDFHNAIEDKDQCEKLI